MLDINALQASIVLDSDRKQVEANREKLKAAMAAISAQMEMVRALIKANQSICKHPSSRNYMDYGGGVNTTCPTCGADW